MSTTERDPSVTTRTRSGRPIPTRPGFRPTFPAPTSPPVAGLASPTVSAAEVVVRHASPPVITYVHEVSVTGVAADALWDLYERALSPLDEIAAMLHVEDRELVLEAFAHPEMIKVVAYDGTTPVGLGMITNRLELVTGVSPSFFANQFPEHADRDRIYYGTAVMVDPTQRGMTIFSRIYTEMWQIPAHTGGVLIFDTCRFNRDNFGADDIVDHIAARFPRSSWSVIDQQSWYAAELPEPVPHA